MFSALPPTFKGIPVRLRYEVTYHHYRASLRGSVA